MLRRMRPRLTYANVAATLALVLATAGSAVAATHYLITSSKQISPKVLKELKAPGKQGAAGTTGATGPQGPAGPQGSTGLTGQQGEKGERGEKGEQGPEGRPGARGEKGEAGGPPGEKGEQGERGERGEQGPEGKLAGNAPHWRVNIAKAGADVEHAEKATLVEISPFKLVGHCYAQGTSTVARTYIELSTGEAFLSEEGEAEGSLIEAGEKNEKPVTSEIAISTTAEHEAEYVGPGEGQFSAETTSASVAIDGSANAAVFLKGTKEPACSFSGYAVSD